MPLPALSPADTLRPQLWPAVRLQPAGVTFHPLEIVAVTFMFSPDAQIASGSEAPPGTVSAVGETPIGSAAAMVVHSGVTFAVSAVSLATNSSLIDGFGCELAVPTAAPMTMEVYADAGGARGPVTKTL